MGSAESRRGAGGLAVVRLSLKRVVPGSVPPWRAPLFSWPRREMRLPGAVFRAPALVFHFRPFLMTQDHSAPAVARRLELLLKRF